MSLTGRPIPPPPSNNKPFEKDNERDKEDERGQGMTQSPELGGQGDSALPDRTTPSSHGGLPMFATRCLLSGQALTITSRERPPLEKRARSRQELRLLGRGGPTQDLVSVREPPEAFDDL
jgi:hypothetical protein